MQSNALSDIGFWSKSTRSKREMQKGIFFFQELGEVFLSPCGFRARVQSNNGDADENAQSACFT